MRNLSKNTLTIFAFTPVVIHLILLLALYESISLITHIPVILLLIVIGISIISDKKIVQQIGSVAIVILTIVLGIIGYYDYFQWFSLIVGIMLLAYFIALKKLKNCKSN